MINFVRSDREYHDNTFEESRSSSRLRERSPEVSKKSHKEVVSCLV